jgi:hypothetical protein
MIAMPVTNQQKPFDPNPIPPDGKYEAFDWSGRLSIDMVREHTRTDDTPGVTDEMLKLYRKAAIEAAELYTGQLLGGKKTMTEVIQLPNNWSRNYYRHQFRYSVATDGYAYVYGRSINMTLPVVAGQQSIRVPRMSHIPDFTNCCDPCATGHDMRVLYWAGYACPDDVPAGIVLGCLQFIAWVVEHPGDELLAMRNKLDASNAAGGTHGRSNIALISGALETWRQYDADAI